MTAIPPPSDDMAHEYIHLEIDAPGFDFGRAKQRAKDLARGRCDNPMILSWKNGRTGESYPDYECGLNAKPFWIRFAEGRGANLTIDFNHGEFIFMILKL